MNRTSAEAVRTQAVLPLSVAGVCAIAAPGTVTQRHDASAISAARPRKINLITSLPPRPTLQPPHEALTAPEMQWLCGDETARPGGARALKAPGCAPYREPRKRSTEA